MSIIGFDTETTGLDPYKGAKVFSFSTCTEEGKTAVYRLDHPTEGARNRERLQDLLANPDIVKVCQNYHFDYAVLKENGYFIHPDTVWEDTLIMSQLHDNIASGHALDAICVRLCSDVNALEEWNDIDKRINKARTIYGTYDKIPEALMTPYQHIDAERVMLVFQSFRKYIHGSPEVYKDYLNEIALVKTTVDFERRGIALCKEESQKLLSWMQNELKEVESESLRLLGEHINWNSADQVSSILYERLKLPILNRTKTGAPSTNKDTLEELRDHAQRMGEQVLSIFDCILRQRSYTKGVAMVSSYIELAGAEGIIHPHINTNIAQTGRESGENPNMQNISKDTALKNRYTVPARKCFRARANCVLFLIDYAGIEMRLIVELTGEPEFVELINRNGDPHALAAEIFYGAKFTDKKTGIDFISRTDSKFKQKYRSEIKRARSEKEREEITDKYYKQVKKTLRTSAKNSQFALAYGARLPRVADTLGLSQEEARTGYNAYCARFPRIYNFTKNMMREIESVGYVTTPFGRRLKTNPVKPFTASNYRVQGTAANIIKLAQIRVDAYLQKNYPDKMYLLLPIHDELIIEMKRELLPKHKEILKDIRRIMITMPEIKIPLDVEIKMTTYTWYQAKEIKV